MEFSRTFNQARKEQGFRSQAHLDAFFTHYDHQKGCAVCQNVGEIPDGQGGYYLVGGDCAEEKRLHILSW